LLGALLTNKWKGNDIRHRTLIKGQSVPKSTQPRMDCLGILTCGLWLTAGASDWTGDSIPQECSQADQLLLEYYVLPRKEYPLPNLKITPSNNPIKQYIAYTHTHTFACIYFMHTHTCALTHKYTHTPLVNRSVMSTKQISQYHLFLLVKKFLLQKHTGTQIDTNTHTHTHTHTHTASNPLQLLMQLNFT
jgi:hypothetical protein